MADEVWRNRVRHVQDGEAADAAVIGRPDIDNELRGNYLKGRLDEADLGEATVAHAVTLAPSLLPDQPVYWNAQTQRFEAALAGVAYDPTVAALLPRASALVLGVVRSKAGATLGDVVLAGRYPTTLAGAVAGTPGPGAYYLSSSDAGRLVLQRPPVSIPVLYWDGTYAYVFPQPRDFLSSHVHYRFLLECAPAGRGIVDGAGRIAVSGPDPDRRGWLPADHPAFDGLAPVGAAFGYNLDADDALAAVFPPTPLAAGVLFWDRGDGLGGTLVPLGANALCQVDARGIWWMSDCPGDVPWPDAFEESSSSLAAVPDNTSAGPECPRLREMRLVFAFTELAADTAGAAVTSLSPAEGSPVTLVDPRGRVATAGPLTIDVDLALPTDDADTAGGRVLKAYDPTAREFRAGWVAEALVAGTGVALASTRPTTVAGTVQHQGIVTVAAAGALDGRELLPQLVRLDRARERLLSSLNVLYLGFPADAYGSAVRAEFYAPAAGLPPSPVATVRALVYGAAAGTLPALAVSVKRLPRPGPAAALALAAAAEVAVPFPAGQTIAAGQYVEVESDAFAVAPGDTILVSIARQAGDGYAGEVGLIRMAAVIAAGS